MKQLAAAILVLALTGSAAAVTSNYQEWWWNPAQNGMGWNVGQQEGTVFVAWYHYDGARRPTFLYMAGTLSNNAVSGTLFRPNGTPPANYNPATFGNVAVGSATLRFTGPNSATFNYSFDSQSGDGLLDFLPNSATKQTALEYIAEEFGEDKADVVFCGDSGNDVFPLTAGFSGVLVRNADDQLVANVKQASEKNPGLKLYFAKGDFKGLNGYYTSGVIEGAYHYGIFDDAEP